MTGRGRASPRPALASPALAQLFGGAAPVMLLIALLGQLAICLVSRNSGPLSISDDDYARVVIAQEFSSAPSPDPSGTSWLPLPFFVNGLSMMVLGATLETARAVSLALALFSVVPLWASARLLGLGPRVASGAVILAAALPTAARLSIATVPEYPTAALLTFAMVSASRTDSAPARPAQLLLWPPFLGAISACLATACRYEAWPVALGISLLLLWRSFTGRRRSSLRREIGAAVLASGFIVLWLLHGIFRKGDMLFFVKRVTDYKHALGGEDPQSWLDVLKGYPTVLLSQEPIPLLLLLLGLLALLLARRSRATSSRGTEAEFAHISLPSLVLLPALLFVALLMGDLRGGAPTHHPGRPLLSLWLLSSVSAAAVLSRALGALDVRLRFAFGAGAVLLVALGQSLAERPQRFAEREKEEALGRTLAKVAPTGAVVISTPDYGYLAVQASAGNPGRFFVADQHDPRDPNPDGSGRARTGALLEQTRAHFLVAPAPFHFPGFAAIQQEGGLSLFQKAPPPDR